MKFKIGSEVIPQTKFYDRDPWFGIRCKVISSWVFKGVNMYLIDNGLDTPENCGKKVYEEQYLDQVV